MIVGDSLCLYIIQEEECLGILILEMIVLSKQHIPI